MAERTATIGSDQGLHARPAALFVKAVKDTGKNIQISKDGGKPVNAGSTLMIMTLGAGKGDVVTLSSDDDGAEATLEQLAEFLEQNHDEG